MTLFPFPFKLSRHSPKYKCLVTWARPRPRPRPKKNGSLSLNQDRTLGVVTSRSNNNSNKLCFNNPSINHKSIHLRAKIFLYKEMVAVERLPAIASAGVIVSATQVAVTPKQWQLQYHHRPLYRPQPQLPPSFVALAPSKPEPTFPSVWDL